MAPKRKVSVIKDQFNSAEPDINVKRKRQCKNEPSNKITQPKEKQAEKAVKRNAKSQVKKEVTVNPVDSKDDSSHRKLSGKVKKKTETTVPNGKLKAPRKGKNAGKTNNSVKEKNSGQVNLEIAKKQNKICNESGSEKFIKCEDEISDLGYFDPLASLRDKANSIQNTSGFDIDYMSSCSSDDSESEVEDQKLALSSTSLKTSSINEGKVLGKTSEESEQKKKDLITDASEVLHLTNSLRSSDDDFETSQVTTPGRKRKACLKTSGSGKQEKRKKIIKTKSEKVEKSSQKSKSKQLSTPKHESKDGVVERLKVMKTDVIKTEINKGRQNLLKHLDESDVASVLMVMEGKKKGDSSEAGPSGSLNESSLSDEESTMDSSEDEGGWEDVQDDPSQRSPKKNQLPEGGVEITIDAPELFKKRKKKQFDWKQYVQRQINRFQKGVREDIHKVHLMCLLVRGMYLNRLCNCPHLTAQAISITPDEFSSRHPNSITMATLSKMVEWFKSVIAINEGQSEKEEMAHVLQKDFEEKRTNNLFEFVLLFIILLRSMGLEVRLVMSLQPLSSKPVKDEASSKLKRKSSSNGKSSTAAKPAKKSEVKAGEHNGESNSQTKKLQQKKGTKTTKGKTSKYFNSSDGEMKVVKLKGKANARKTDLKEQGCDLKDVSEKYKMKSRSLRSRGSKVKPSSYKQGSDEEEEETDSDESFIPVSDTENDDSVKPKIKRKTKQVQKGRKCKEVRSAESNSSDNESDFEPDQTQFRSPLTTKKPLKNNRKVLSSDSDETNSGNTARSGCDQWVEVYLKTEKKWICVNFIKWELNAPYAIESHATQPVHYVLAHDNKGHIKDVTARYAANWLTDTRKLRADPDWIEEMYAPFLDPDTEAGEKEDTAIKDTLIRRPMPTSVGAFKGHPLYALKRHLLKFEAIYPNSAVPLGFIRGEPVYARDCVHVLHSRENWLKEGRAVRLGEESYKMVKSRPKWNRPKENPDALDLELFGEWQTEDYIPPPAVDGKVPRNEYGNVELFKPSMLPAGTVYLKVPGLNKVAKKLGVDCVPAMLGWDTHCGFSHPVLEGFVVCEEYKDILLAAWDEDQEIQRQKEAEKKEKRVIANWKLLTKGLLIKDKLKARFDLQTKESSEIQLEKCDDPTAVKAGDFEKSWPQNRESKKKRKKKYGEAEVI
ncbi:DNA repair protein complementing XP-C cells-like [Ylistrum balloti]|uniref:DNA repair protein complementing XP-C cells-like n=1 Tax=Ylistrum balloti TaxID=509963 RepID=UPI00290582C8|nr:DNA repair protein complementing XP-C cells-like [Ylistrum balloti]